MMNFIDKKLNAVTMYRLVLYYLMGLLVCAMFLGYVGILPFTPLALVLETMYITGVCVITNVIFARVFKAPTNVESVYITALILVFLITPLKSFGDTAFYALGFWASVLAMASKYILAIKRKHIFNPAAVAVVITAFGLGLSASWWVGTPWMVVPVLVGGLLLTRKLLRTDLILGFLGTAVVGILVSHFFTGGSVITDLERLFFSSPVFFFAFVMLTEPLTMPPTRTLRIWYGVLTGLLFAPAIHIGSLYFTPELALVFGNIFSYSVSPKEKLVLILQERKEIAKDTYDFIFVTERRFSFEPGQYLEWTYAHTGSDSRGHRRHFTLASSPTEANLRIGVKFYSKMSTYKRELLRMKPGEIVVASQKAGDFVMPKDKNKKLAFMAGGIGITPFRSMLKLLIDRGEKRDIVLFYSNKTIQDVAYTDVLDDAYDTLGIPTVYTLTDKHLIPEAWRGERGFVNADVVKRNTPDFLDRIFYLSGPHGMVIAFETMLLDMGVRGSAIKKDFFPGFA